MNNASKWVTPKKVQEATETPVKEKTVKAKVAKVKKEKVTKK